MAAPLWRRLLVIVAVSILPLAVTAGVGLYALQAEQRRQVERVGLELSRSVANAVDAELRSAVATLETLSTAPSLDDTDLAAFDERATRVLRTRPGWAAIQVSAPDGTVRLEHRSADGSLLPADSASLEQAVRTRAAVTGNLVGAPDAGWYFAVRVPVLRGSRLVAVISAWMTPGVVYNAISRQHLPEDWIISIVDGNGLRVARSRAHDENVGGHLSPTARQVVDRGGAEGFGVSYTLEGERIFTPYTRLPNGWLAVLGLPTAIADAGALRALTTYGGGLLLSIAIGAMGGLWIARTIAQPMRELGAAAEALGRRETPRVPVTSIREIDAVARSVQAAAVDLARSQADREELLRRERAARASAEAADRAKDEFLAILSHELRTPLNAVAGWAHMLESGRLKDADAEARAKSAIVRNSTAQMRLIDELLDVSRITTGKLRLEVTRVDLVQVLQAAVDAVRPAADARQVRLQLAIPSDPCIVSGDQGRLQQVMWNLLMNAVKFTHAGDDVDVRVERVDSMLRIVVRDHGQGIAADILPHVFERFRQADSSSTRLHGGLGLGLALVKHLIELHGGTATAESDGAGHGATFTVTLPAAAPDPLSASSLSVTGAPYVS